MNKTITTIVVVAVTIASIGTASAQSTTRTVTQNLVGPRLTSPTVTANPTAVPPVPQQATTLVAPAVVQQPNPFTAPPVPYTAPARTVVQPQVPAPVVAPVPSFVLPATCAFLTKLEFNGRMVSQGMQVVSVNCSGLAQRMGLEAGDIVASINGQSIHCERDYHEALFNAAVYGGGNVTLQVLNVRWTPGCIHSQQFVTIAAQLPRRVTVPVPATIAAR